MNDDAPWDATMPVITMNLPEAEARALLVLIEVGAKEIRHRRDTGKYTHQCQRDISEAVLAHADEMHANILRVLTKGGVQ